MMIECREIITISVGYDGMSRIGLLALYAEDYRIAGIEIGVDHII